MIGSIQYQPAMMSTIPASCPWSSKDVVGMASNQARPCSSSWAQLMGLAGAITLFLVALERFFGTGFFDPRLGGDPVHRQGGVDVHPRFVGLQHGYARYIIAYNWSSVLVIALLMPPLILLDLGLVGPGFAVFLSFVLMLVSLYYRWYVAQTAFATTGLIAGALVLADVALSLLVNRLVA